MEERAEDMTVVKVSVESYVITVKVVNALALRMSLLLVSHSQCEPQ